MAVRDRHRAVALARVPLELARGDARAAEFALLGTPEIWLRVISRIVLIPVIAGIAYELLRLGGKYPNSALMKLIVAPGLLLQSLTTRYPDHSQMEVAIASMRELLQREGDGGPPASPVDDLSIDELPAPIPPVLPSPLP